MSEPNSRRDAPPDPRAVIGFERRRQMQVRAALMAGLAQPGAPGPARAAFLLACGEYLVASLTRLDAQDMAILTRLRARVPAAEAEVHEGLAALEARQAQARAATAAFAETIDRYRAGRLDAAAFEAAVRDFAALIQGMMAPRRNPYERHTDALFTAADWAAIADADPQALARETHLFAHVRAAAPAGADPEAMPALHGGPPAGKR
jgi:hypothetical protein